MLFQKTTIYFFALFLYIFQVKASEIYTITQLNLENKRDIHSVCQIFDDPTTAQQCVVPQKKAVYYYLTTEGTIPISQRLNQLFVCKNKYNQACGLLIFSPDIQEKITHIILLAVHKDHRKHGVASALLHTAEKYSRHQSINTLTLSVHHHNTQAIACYTKNGFEAEPVTKFKADCYNTILQAFPCCYALRKTFAFNMIKECTKKN